MGRIAFREGYKYQLAADYSVRTAVLPETELSDRFIRLDTDGTLTVREDYAWDGPSGPTVDSPCAMRASLVHDALYQLLREQLLPATAREIADREFHRICLEDGMAPGRAKLWYDMVRCFAGGAADPRNDKPILSAP